MITHTTASTSERGLPIILLVLTSVTGIVDAVSYLGVGRVFTANMTGNIVLLAFAASGAPGLSVAPSMTAIATFYIGAVAGGRLASTIGAVSRKRWISSAFGLEAGLLLASTLTAIGFPSGVSVHSPQVYVIVILTALAMGVRNATVRKLGVADLTTTALTMTVTSLAADSSLAGGSNPNARRRLGSVVLMFGGAAIGALLVRHSLALPLAVCTVVSGFCAAAARLFPPSQSLPPPHPF